MNILERRRKIREKRLRKEEKEKLKLKKAIKRALIKHARKGQDRMSLLVNFPSWNYYLNVQDIREIMNELNEIYKGQVIFKEPYLDLHLTEFIRIEEEIEK